MVEVRLSLQPWLTAALEMTLALALIGYWITPEDFGRFIESAVLVEIK